MHWKCFSLQGMLLRFHQPDCKSFVSYLSSCKEIHIYILILPSTYFKINGLQCPLIVKIRSKAIGFAEGWMLHTPSIPLSCPIPVTHNLKYGTTRWRDIRWSVIFLLERINIQPPYKYIDHNSAVSWNEINSSLCLR